MLGCSCVVANGDSSYSAAIVEFLAEAIAMHDITWLEEPLPMDDREAYAKLRAFGYVEIAAGEHEHDFLGFRTLLGETAWISCRPMFPTMVDSRESQKLSICVKSDTQPLHFIIGERLLKQWWMH